MSLHLSTVIKAIKVIHMPPILVPTTFAECAQPDSSFEIAGLTVNVYGPGLPFASYATVTPTHPPPRVPEVAEPGTGALLLMGLAVFLAICNWGGKRA